LASAAREQGKTSHSGGDRTKHDLAGADSTMWPVE
jgi:hypothetical protein